MPVLEGRFSELVDFLHANTIIYWGKLPILETLP
jgi:hypothetical protein